MCPVKAGMIWPLPTSPSLSEWISLLFYSLKVILPERFPWPRSSVKYIVPFKLLVQSLALSLEYKLQRGRDNMHSTHYYSLALRAWCLAQRRHSIKTGSGTSIGISIDLLHRIPVKQHRIDTYQALFSKNFWSRKDSYLNENSFQSLTFIFIVIHLNL